ncbi:MAG: TRCF domain-containing protein, partial [Endozoicomonas sp.]
VHSRLILYKRIAAAANDQELKNLQVELIDRFGLLPEPAKNLFRQMRLKLNAQALGIRKLDAGHGEGRVEFEEQPKVNPMTLIQLIQTSPRQFKLEGGNILKYIEPMETPEKRFKATERLLERLAGE